MAAANPPAMPRGTGPSAPSDLHNRAKPGGGETLHVCSRETGSAGSTLCSEPPCATCLGKLGPERQAPKPGPQKQGLGQLPPRRGLQLGWHQHLAGLTGRTWPPPPAAHPAEHTSTSSPWEPHPRGRPRLGCSVGFSGGDKRQGCSQHSCFLETRLPEDYPWCCLNGESVLQQVGPSQKTSLCCPGCWGPGRSPICYGQGQWGALGFIICIGKHTRGHFRHRDRLWTGW